MRTTTSLLVLALLGGCVAAGPATISGRPEMVVRLDAKTVKAQLINAYSAAGYNIDASDDMGFAISQPMTGMQEALIGRGVHRIRFNLLESIDGNEGTTTIRSTSFLVADSVSTETSNATAGVDVQESLERLFGHARVPSATPAR